MYHIFTTFKIINQFLFAHPTLLHPQSCKIAAEYSKIPTPARSRRKRVRDVIPESRLASYGDFEYEEDAGDATEVRTDEETARTTAASATNGVETTSRQDEPWLLDEVEEYIARVATMPRTRRSRPGRETLVHKGCIGGYVGP